MSGLLANLRRLGVAVSVLPIVASTALAQPDGEAVSIVQSRGVDQSLRYTDLEKYGPWDDRNYGLTADDLAYLSADEAKLYNQIPAFFRVELRKMWPHLPKSGPVQYPRAALQMFGHRYGGLMQNGKIENDRRVAAKAHAEKSPGREVQINQIVGANEITIAVNPVNTDQVIAGANNAGGQEMYYSVDGGASWTVQGVLPNTCCDPTVDWSSDGSIAYAAALSGAIGVSAWRSFDGGQTWVDRVDLTTSGSDKEFIHVDRSPSSDYQDSVYMTYHNGNVMQFARSTDNGLSYQIQSFPAEPRGIGSDITTDSAGNIYYFYGAFSAQQVVMLKSTDGGDTFEAGFPVASTNGSFDFPIPSMETRRAWINASTDADRSGGAFDGSIYVTWADTVDPENDADPNANHTRVYVAYSRDQGATWTLTTPHSIDDMDTVDRWQPWLSVDETGSVHVTFYDTRNSVDRTGVDLYYANSADGGDTWSEPVRVSTATSANLTGAQEFGDYNGLSVPSDKVLAVWTDNRDGPPNQRDVFSDDAENTLASPGFTLGANPSSSTVCVPTALEDITVRVGSVQGFVEPVTLNLANLPAGFSGGFTTPTVIPAVPANTSVAQVSVGSVSAGEYTFSIAGTATGANDRSSTIRVNAFDSVPPVANLLAPANGATDTQTTAALSWEALPDVSTYTVELDDDPAFGSIDFTAQTSATSIIPNVFLSSETTYYWRVRADNICGTGPNSAVFSFTTALEICSVGFGAIPDTGAISDTLVVSESGELADLNVSVQITHTWVGDIKVTLLHEDTGTSADLIDRPLYQGAGFGCSLNNISVTLDDEGTSPVENACSGNPAVSGVLTPNQPLSAFDFEALPGTWRLDVSDNAGGDVGTLDRWCLVPAIPDPSLDTDNDGQTDAREIACGSDPEDDTSLSPDNDSDNDPDCADPDDDNDGMTDEWEQLFNLNPFDPADADIDSDGDGFNNIVEFQQGTDPTDEASFPRAVKGDFDGDGRADILWRNGTSGQNWMYLMNGPTIASNVGINSVSTAWEVVGNGDYDGDGNVDVLWRNSSTGQNWMYLMDGASISSSLGVNTISDLDWQVVGNGDYNADGKSDILWRNFTTGQNWMYLMDGATISGSIGVNVVGLVWEVVGSGDYNGDGRADVLWRNTASGENWMYLMDGPIIVTSTSINKAAPSWKVAGNGDYDGNGKSDILWRNSTSGQNWMYLMDGPVISTSVGINTVPTDWEVAGDGDYDGDGRSDVLWRNKTSGENWMYLMNGTAISSSVGINAVSTTWGIVNPP